MDWSLFACGHSGHITYAPDEPAVREQLSARTDTGEAWRCLRCATFVAGQPGMSGPASQAPMVRRGDEVRSAFILRVFAIERYLRAVAAAVLSFVIWRLGYSRQSIEQAFDREFPLLRQLFRQVGYNIDNSKLVGLIHHALTLSPTTIKLVAAGLALYAAIEVVEGTGLWLLRRWGEYFAMVATSLGLPYEIYDLISGVTVTRLALFAINLALVIYLVIAKRLLGVRGGKRAYEARLRSESIMDGAVSAAAASGHAAPPGGEQGGQPTADERAADERAAPSAGDQASPAGAQNAPHPGGEDGESPAGKHTAPGGKNTAPGGKNTAPGGKDGESPGGKRSGPQRRASSRAGWPSLTARRFSRR